MMAHTADDMRPIGEYTYEQLDKWDDSPHRKGMEMAA
jgi:hypothetical protein